MPQSIRRALPAALSALALACALTPAAAESAGDLALAAGRAAWSRQDGAAAVTALSRATLLLDGGEPATTARAYFYLGLAYLDSGMAEEALVALERSIELGGGGASGSEIRRWQAVAAASLGHREAADAYRQQALSSEPPLAPASTPAPAAVPRPAEAPAGASEATAPPPATAPVPATPPPQESAFEHLFGKRRPPADPARPPA